jgi:hypothetical protein
LFENSAACCTEKICVGTKIPIVLPYHHQGVTNGTLATEATVEPSASQPATAKAAATRKGLAETAIPEVVGTLPTRAPGIEVLLALDPLHAGLMILVELIKVRRGCGGALAPQLTLRPAHQGTLEIPSPRRRPASWTHFLF